MNFNAVRQILKPFDPNNLKGTEAHFEIAPYRVNHFKSTPNSPRKAAVLILLYPIQNISHFALIQRPNYEGKHSGQISFPGGKWEKEDLSLNHTALREAWEETNISEKDVELLGNLSQIYIPPSNFEVTPVLGISENRPLFKPDKREVNEIIEVPLSELLDQSNLKTTELKIENGKRLSTPYFDLRSKIVWGATAMMLNELRHYLSKARF